MFKAQCIHHSNSDSSLEINHPLLHDLIHIYNHKISIISKSNNDIINTEISINGDIINTDTTIRNDDIDTRINTNPTVNFDNYHTFDDDHEAKVFKLSLLLSSCGLDTNTHTLSHYLYSNGISDIITLANINIDDIKIIVNNNNMVTTTTTITSATTPTSTTPTSTTTTTTTNLLSRHF